MFGGRVSGKSLALRRGLRRGGMTACLQMLKGHRAHGCMLHGSCHVILVCPGTFSIGRSSPLDVTLEPPELRAKAMSFLIKL